MRALEAFRAEVGIQAAGIVVVIQACGGHGVHQTCLRAQQAVDTARRVAEVFAGSRREVRAIWNDRMLALAWLAVIAEAP